MCFKQHIRTGLNNTSLKNLFEGDFSQWTQQLRKSCVEKYGDQDLSDLGVGWQWTEFYDFWVVNCCKGLCRIKQHMQSCDHGSSWWTFCTHFLTFYILNLWIIQKKVNNRFKRWLLFLVHSLYEALGRIPDNWKSSKLTFQWDRVNGVGWGWRRHFFVFGWRWRLCGLVGFDHRSSPAAWAKTLYMPELLTHTYTALRPTEPWRQLQNFSFWLELHFVITNVKICSTANFCHDWDDAKQLRFNITMTKW